MERICTLSLTGYDPTSWILGRKENGYHLIDTGGRELVFWVKRPDKSGELCRTKDYPSGRLSAAATAINAPPAADKGDTGAVPIYFYSEEIENDWNYDLREFWYFVRDFPERLEGKAVGDCEDLRRRLDGRPFSLDVAHILTVSRCPRTSVLGHLRRPRVTMFKGPPSLAQEVYDHLDVTGLDWKPSRLAARSGVRGLAQLKLEHGFNRDGFWIHSGDWSASITFLAVADFDGDGRQDIFGVVHQSGTGRWDDCMPLLLTRKDVDGAVFVTPIKITKPEYFTPPEALVKSAINLDPRYDD